MMYQMPMVYGYPQTMYAPSPYIVPQQGMIPMQQPRQQVRQQTQPQTQRAAPPATVELNQKDLQALREMCPGLDEEVISSVLMSAGGNIDRAAGQLLEMSAE